jgi:hypothetical protein
MMSRGEPESLVPSAITRAVTSIFSEFSCKIDRVLEASNDSDLVIETLNLLADGNPAVLAGADIEALSGLRSKLPLDVSGCYRETMLRLLTWGIQTFAQDPEHEGLRLWKAMSIFDGSAGYSQGYAMSAGK